MGQLRMHRSLLACSSGDWEARIQALTSRKDLHHSMREGRRAKGSTGVELALSITVLISLMKPSGFAGSHRSLLLLPPQWILSVTVALGEDRLKQDR